ncbi:MULTISPECIES: transglycosylase SLT domain-containing protein [Acinetobacter]|uniref:lytic transglycosylase domain-containing protein n=2 Tax=Moraxellaceae TaxID=468 RepID=UPI000C696B5F|nr:MULTISPECIES: transglycosylase SLT domain-containing protein [Acinetobacter]MEC8568469.1 transglycosylase SLT domain-containing protein [Pseudomonadota bacterium]MBC68645.1 transglycosylase [Acinetobacter sp.]MBT48689.1 transglycosylase [Acinetobacter sp.]HIQ35390.1 lytic transglycosylase domain-containing protein [Acinetobacter venetianus]HJP46944.1 transglycosylase SLT domain-containing protein [Acinetobacter venetianus]
MDKTTYFFALCLGTIGFLNSSVSTYAGQMIYQFKDTNGTTLLTNKKKAEYSHLKVVKATYYPDSNIHSYSNWGASEASVLPSYSRNKNAFDQLIRQAAQQHGVSEGLIKAVMHTESGFNIKARSPVGAQGLMQLMPATARRFNVSNAYDPQQNIFAGAKYLSWLLKRFNGDTRLAIAAYNAGEGNVDKYGGIPPFRETQDYVRRVTSRYQNLYASGLGTNLSESSNNNQTGQVLAQSANYTSSNNSSSPTATPPPKQYNRQIITLADGTFTDAPAGTYTTANAVASAHIRLSD